MKLSYKNTDFRDFFIVESLFGLAIWSTYGLLNSADFKNILVLIPITLFSALLSEFYNFFVYSKGDLNTIESVISIYPVFTIIFAHILLGEVLSESFAFALILIIGGIVLISFQISLTGMRLNRSILWALSGAIAIGLSDTVSKSFIDNYTSYEFLVSLGISQTILSALLILMSKSRFHNIRRIDRKTLCGTFLIALSMVFFWETFNNSLASIASSLTASVIVLIVILSRVILKERIPLKNYIGIAITLIGVILLQ